MKRGRCSERAFPCANLTLQETNLDLECIAIAVGTFAMTIAVFAVVGHYRRERLRATILRNLDTFDNCA